MDFGPDIVGLLGNGSTAALKDETWQASTKNDKEILAGNYGSGDAAEASPMRLRAGWQDAASTFGFVVA